MDIVVASHNPVKIRAVETAFSNQFPDEILRVHPVNADSGVSKQPHSDNETRQGAKNRVTNSRLAQPAADYWVGLEGGTMEIGEQLMAFAWMAVENEAGRFSEARSVTLPLPETVKALISNGLELGEANDQVFSTVNSKQKGGAFGLLTNGLYTRESVYVQTMTIALIPFVNELFLQTE